MTAVEKTIEGEIMPQEIVAYNPFRAQIAEMKSINEKTVFQYADPKGNKEARSYIHKLRLSKGEIERVRKAEKAASLEYGRKVDAEAKSLTEEIEAMIAVHQAPLDEIEQREKNRVAEIQKRRDDMKLAAMGLEELTAAQLQERLQSVEAVIIDASFAEFQAAAQEEKTASISALVIARDKAIKREAEAAELDRLRREEEERKQREREERIAREAAERARIEAEAKAKAEAEAAEKKAREEREAIERKAREEREAAEREQKRLRDEAEQKERERLAAEEKAKRSAEEERQRIQREQEEKAAEEAKREADRKHQAKIHGEIIAALSACGINEEQAKAAIVAIRKGDVPHIKIIY